MRLPYLFITAALLTSGVAMAQEKKKDSDKNLRLHYERSTGNRTQIIDRSFENQAQLDKFLDSLNANQSSGGRTRIIIGDDKDAILRLNDSDGLYSFRTPKAPKAPKTPRAYRNDEPLARGEWKRFENDMERFGKDMERWGKDFGDKFERNFRFESPNLNSLPKADLAPLTFNWEGGSSSKTVRSLNVYPNRPFNQTLNIRFTAPTKGDVIILVTDVKGREVAKETIKDFEGEYVGQVSLSKKAEKGTFFVTVTQGEDGTVKRVVVE